MTITRLSLQLTLCGVDPVSLAVCCLLHVRPAKVQQCLPSLSLFLSLPFPTSPLPCSVSPMLLPHVTLYLPYKHKAPPMTLTSPTLTFVMPKGKKTKFCERNGLPGKKRRDGVLKFPQERIVEQTFFLLFVSSSLLSSASQLPPLDSFR